MWHFSAWQLRDTEGDSGTGQAGQRDSNCPELNFATIFGTIYKSQKAKGESEAGEVDLNVVRELKERIVSMEAELANLRGLAGNLVPTIDGMPTVRSLTSRVEALSVKVVTAERELDRLKSEFDRQAALLFDEIQRRVKTSTAATILIMRYVCCLSFRQIAKRICYSLRQVFRLKQQGVAEYESFEEATS